jgi:hypothetical protein
MKKHDYVFVETPSRGAEHIFAQNRSTMTEITHDCYHHIARSLARSIGPADYFNGSVSYESPEFSSTLTATLLIYRSPERLPEGLLRRVEDIRPVWWELSTTLPCGTATLNDFSFSTLHENLLEICE